MISPVRTFSLSRLAVVLGMAGALVVGSALPALAHTSAVHHQESCSADGVTTTVVTFDNDYGLTAVVSYRWGAGSFSTVNLAKKTTSAKPTVSLPAHAVGTLTYHVVWSDNFRQPTAPAESTLTIGSLQGCNPPPSSSSTTTTTTAPPTTTTTQPPTTTTTVAAPTTTTTAAPTTTTTLAPVTTTTAAPTQVLGEVLTAPPAPTPELPATGSDARGWLLAAAVLIVSGLVLRAGNRKTKADQA